MDFSFSDEQLAMADLAKQILTDGADPVRMRELERSGTRFDPDLWRELAEAGLLGIAIEEKYGGADLGFFELSLAIEQLGRTTAPVPLLETSVLGALPISRYGSDAQKEAILPKVADGSMILTAALTEAEADPRKPVTTATADNAGGGWKLDGIKICVPAGQLAQKILVPATGADGRVGLFLVPVDAAGLSMEALTTTSRQPEVALELAGVRVSESDLLGDWKRGGEILDWLLECATSALCSLALGVTEAAVELTAAYTKERKQFGQPIATFQAVGQRAADAFVDTEGVRLTAWQAAWRLAEGLDASKEVAVAKIWAAEAGQRVVHAAVHLHGGMGVDRDYPLHRHFLYAKSLELALGGSSAQLRRLGAILASEEAA